MLCHMRVTLHLLIRLFLLVNERAVVCTYEVMLNLHHLILLFSCEINDGRCSRVSFTGLSG